MKKIRAYLIIPLCVLLLAGILIKLYLKESRKKVKVDLIESVLEISLPQEYELRDGSRTIKDNKGNSSNHIIFYSVFEEGSSKKMEALLYDASVSSTGNSIRKWKKQEGKFELVTKEGLEGIHVRCSYLISNRTLYFEMF